MEPKLRGLSERYAEKLEAVEIDPIRKFIGTKH